MNESEGIRLITEERARQRDEEGYQDGHDDTHVGEELALAAMIYAAPDRVKYDEDFALIVEFWPWGTTEPESFRPTPGNRMRELVKAGALIAAEIDRLTRLNPRTYWNGEEAKACRCRVIVAAAPEFPLYWARDLVGQERDAVMIQYNGETFYIDNDDGEGQDAYPGCGWHKVTTGLGGPGIPHRTLKVERIVSTETDGAC